MLSMRKDFCQRLLSKFADFPAVSKVAVAVSGGCDSVALLLLLHQLSRMKKFEVCVFHVNHNLRENGAKDLGWVHQLAKILSIPFFARTANLMDNQSIQAEGGTEAWARKFRYESFQEMSGESGAEVVATGHTADDQLETIIMRLFTGTSLQGITGIRSHSELLVNGKLLKLWRPMIKVQRAQLEEFLSAVNQEWCVDETNLADKFQRNSVRHRLIPPVLDLFPKAGEKVAAVMEDIEKMQDFIFFQAKEYLLENLKANTLCTFPLPDVIKREVLRQWLLELGFTREISRSFIVRILDLWEKKAGNRQLNHRNYCFLKEKGKIVFQKTD